MIKLIVTIDSERGLCDLNLKKIKDYQAKMLLKGHLEPLRRAFDDEDDIPAFFSKNRNLHVYGSSKLYEQVFPYADQLLITHIDGIYDCSKHFPRFEDKFVLKKRSRILNENGVEFQHQVWINKSLADAKSTRNADTRDSEWRS